MAWPVSSIYQTIVVGSTQITKGFGDAMQNAIYRLYGGLRSVKSLTVDGTGDQDASGNTVGAATLNGASGDTSPAIVMSSAPSTRKLWFYALGGTKKVRIYVTSSAIEIVVNAAWNGAKWARDTSGNSSKLRLSTIDISYWAYPSTGASPWDDSDWGYRTPGTEDASFSLGIETFFATKLLSATDVIASAGNVEALGDPASDRARFKGKQIVSSAAAKPTIAAGANIGTAGTYTIAVLDGSTDMAGWITIVPGTSCSAGVMATITLNKSYPTAPVVVISPYGAAGYVAMNDIVHVGLVTSNSFEIRANNPTSGDAYSLAYHVIGVAA